MLLLSCCRGTFSDAGVSETENKLECSKSGFFFFQAEDGIRDLTATGVQTCALPILDPYVPAMVGTQGIANAQSAGGFTTAEMARIRSQMHLVSFLGWPRNWVSLRCSYGTIEDRKSVV